MSAPAISEHGTAHYLAPAGKTSTPAVVICLDSETRHHDVHGEEVHALRCWDASITYRRDRRRPGEVREEKGTTTAEAADQIDAWASSVKSCWLYAHNVTFDMVVTDLPAQLAARGWELSSRFGSFSGSLWLVLHKGRREYTRSGPSQGARAGHVRAEWAHTLTIADSASLLPVPLAELAPFTGVRKPPLPADDDSAGAWAARCNADTMILRHLVLSLMDWWDEHDMGPWSVTGAGLGWQTYRRTLGNREVVIDHDPAVIAWERQAVYGGRRDVFRAGELAPGRYGEIDYAAAYPTIAAHEPLPARIACRLSDQNKRDALRGKGLTGMIAEVTITTSVPRWPLRTPQGVFYPVGTFRTVLAGPDLKTAYQHGALAAVHDGYLYAMTRHLKPWAERVLDWARPGRGGAAGIVAVAAKLWSRAVIGKFAQSGWRTVPWIGPPCDSWVVEDCSDLYTGARSVITGLAGQYYKSYPGQRGEHERPAVLAFVEAHVRSRLGAIIAGPYGAAIIQCDTDGVMVSHGDMRSLAAERGRTWHHGRQVSPGPDHVIAEWNKASWPLVMRDKAQFTRVVVYGPQHVMLDGRPRFAGVPRGAWDAGGGRWAARLWPGLLWQAQRASPGQFSRPVQGYLITGPYAPGWVLADGVVRPAETRVGEDGGSHLLPWEKTRWAAAGDRLGPSQSAWAAALEESCSGG